MLSNSRGDLTVHNVPPLSLADDRAEASNSTSSMAASTVVPASGSSERTEYAQGDSSGASVASESATMIPEHSKQSSEQSQMPPGQDKSDKVPIVRSNTPVCQNCLTSTTPLWRRDEGGHIMCNACGLFLKLHGRRRPISLKTDVIKSRNRNRNNAQAVVSTAAPRAASGGRKRATSSISASSVASASVKKSPRLEPTSSPQIQLRKRHNQSSSQGPISTTQGTPQGTPQAQNHAPAPTQGQPQLPSSVQMQSQAPPPAVQPQFQPQTQVMQLPGIQGLVYPSSPALSPYTGQPYGLAAPPQPQPPQPKVEGTPMSPHIGATGGPQSGINRSDSPPEVRLVRGPMSEQLLPRSPPGGLERIPPLAGLPYPMARGPYMSQSQAPPPSQDPHKQPTQAELITKVSELELVNDLLRRRISDLEYAEGHARKVAVESQATARALWEQLDLIKRQLANVSHADAQSQPPFQQFQPQNRPQTQPQQQSQSPSQPPSQPRADQTQADQSQADQSQTDHPQIKQDQSHLQSQSEHVHPPPEQHQPPQDQSDNPLNDTGNPVKRIRVSELV